jgi:hypothetical protein
VAETPEYSACTPLERATLNPTPKGPGFAIVTNANPRLLPVSYSTVAVLLVIPRTRSSGAASIASYGFTALPPL